MADGKPTIIWYGNDHADAYLLAAALHLARAGRAPSTLPLPPPSVSATLYCAFAAEAYVNVALLRILDETEYRPVSQVGVRSKFFLATRLGAREEWFTGGEQTLEDLDELFQERNRLVHAQPEGSVMHPFSDPEHPKLHNDVSNVGRWLAATIDAVSRLGRSHAELGSFDRVAGRLSEQEPVLRSFDADRDGPALDRAVRSLMKDLLSEDHEEYMDAEDFERFLDQHDPDWDIDGLGS